MIKKLEWDWKEFGWVGPAYDMEAIVAHTGLSAEVIEDNVGKRLHGSSVNMFIDDYNEKVRIMDRLSCMVNKKITGFDVILGDGALIIRLETDAGTHILDMQGLASEGNASLAVCLDRNILYES